tara:strand:- start:3862 stop:4050 length:189 start_codon:yes stop_codon:yes gene_type:complete
MVRRKKPEIGADDIVGIVLTNPKEKSLSFTPSALALILVVDVMWGDEVEHFVPIEELIICKS